MARLILDTTILIAAARRRLDLATISEDDDAAVPAVVVAEYLVGVHLTADAARAADQRAFLDDVLAVAPIVDYTRDVAEHHAVLLAHVRRAGEPRGAHDLIVAASARATEQTVLTADSRARFDELPGVRVRLVSTR